MTAKPRTSRGWNPYEATPGVAEITPASCAPSVVGGDDRDADNLLHSFEGKVVVLYVCEHHGFAGLNLPGTTVQCRQCGQSLFASIADLIFAEPNTIKPLRVGGE